MNKREDTDVRKKHANKHVKLIGILTLLRNIYLNLFKFNFYLAEHTHIYIHYKDQSLNGVHGHKSVFIVRSVPSM
jgi:hypothetical protein